MKQAPVVVTLCAIVVVVVSLGYFTLAKLRCSPTVAFDIPITRSAWHGQLRWKACGFGVSGDAELVVENSQSGEVFVIAQGDDLNRGIMSSYESGSFVLTIPNRSNIELKSILVPGLSISVHYTPSDNPEDRKSYLAWYKDKTDEVNKAWFCRNVFPNFSLLEAKHRDEGWAHTLYNPPRTSYCLSSSSG